MTWTKLSDDFSDDCWRLSDEAFRVHVEGLLWNNRKLLDLVLLKDEMRLWAKRPEAAQELVDCGWWADHGDRYVIVHHAAYQRTREAVLNQQAVNKKNGKKGGKPKREQATDLQPAEPPETESVSESLSESQTERDRTGLDRTGAYKGKREKVASHNGCRCGRPAPVNGDGVCHWCTIKTTHEAMSS